MTRELHLQIKLIEIQNLLAQAQLEPRLKGPFPVALYRDILTSLQTILDRLHSMRCVTTREEWYTVSRVMIISVFILNGHPTHTECAQRLHHACEQGAA